MAPRKQPKRKLRAVLTKAGSSHPMFVPKSYKKKIAQN
jgi:hypothetical protein